MSEKYSYEFKMKIVEEYLEGALGYRLLAKRYNVSHHSLIVKWVNPYRESGKQGLQRKKTHKKYPLNFKLDVLRFKQDTGASYRETANAFGISEPSIISNWKRVYTIEGAPGLNKLQGRPPQMSKSNKDNQKKSQKKKVDDTSEIERLKKENDYLRIELAYLKKLEELGLKDPREDNNQK